MSPRSRNRREFDVRPAGYFTVLRPSERFSTLRLLGGFRHLVNGPAVPEWLEKPAGAAIAGSLQSPAVSTSLEVPLRIGMLDTRNRNWAQFAMIACAAAAITYILLGWISGGR